LGRCSYDDILQRSATSGKEKATKGFGTGLGLFLGDEVTAVKTQILEAFRKLAACAMITAFQVIPAFGVLKLDWLHLLLRQLGPALPCGTR